MTKLEIAGCDKKGPVKLSIQVNNQFDSDGIWLRGNLHCHVGQMGEPAAVCRHYQDLGFDFLASSDYNRITPLPKSTERFVTLPGAELGSEFGPHIVCVGLGENIRPMDGTVRDVARVVRQADAQGGLAILAHPYWSDFNWQQLYQLACTGVAGFEISNRLAWRINGKQRSEALWQMLLNEDVRLAAIGVDDTHILHEQLVTGRTWTGMLARDRTAAGLLDAIRSQRTYASEAPEIRSIRFEQRGVIAVRCSPCAACHFMSAGFGVRTMVSEAPAEYFEVDLAVEGYRLRDWLCICLEDQSGRRAWSSAIPVAVQSTPIG